jgi:hypothetical protein
LVLVKPSRRPTVITRHQTHPLDGSYGVLEADGPSARPSPANIRNNEI